jgi:IclR family transcriptional regulator, KDG regulon repressor
MTEKSGGTTIAAVDKALGILNLFSEQQTELGITEMAQLTGLHKSTLAGLVYTLERNGYLSQNVESRKYRLGLRLAERAAVALNQHQVLIVAQKHMEALLNKRNESINFGVREGIEVVYLAHLTSNQQLSVRVKIGKRGHLHSTALGKAILSVTPETVRRQIIDTLTLEAMTPYTITTVARLTDELNNCATQGYSVDN